MALTHSSERSLGTPAPEFDLPGIDGRRWTLADARGPQGLVVMFICNHCPYVQAIQERLVEDCKAIQRIGIQCVAIMSNDAQQYPEDSFNNMIRAASRFAYPFPYLLDESQDVARAYGAVCTPDFFGFNANLELQYRGRLDAGGIKPVVDELPRELVLAMNEIARTGKGPREQYPSMGCSIKWK